MLSADIDVDRARSSGDGEEDSPEHYQTSPNSFIFQQIYQDLEDSFENFIFDLSFNVSIGYLGFDECYEKVLKKINIYFILKNGNSYIILKSSFLKNKIFIPNSNISKDQQKLISKIGNKLKIKLNMEYPQFIQNFLYRNCTQLIRSYKKAFSGGVNGVYSEYTLELCSPGSPECTKE